MLYMFPKVTEEQNVFVFFISVCPRVDRLENHQLLIIWIMENHPGATHHNEAIAKSRSCLKLK